MTRKLYLDDVSGETIAIAASDSLDKLREIHTQADATRSKRETAEAVAERITGQHSGRFKHEQTWGTSRADSLLDEGGLVLAISGAKGAGKTVLGSTAADCPYVKSRAGDPSLPVLFLDVEGGMRSVRHRSDCEFKAILTWSEYEKFIDRLISTPPPLPWGCIVIDNASELAELSMETLLKQARKSVPEWPEFRKNTQEMTVQVRKLRDLARATGIVIIFNVWDDQKTDESGNIRKVGVDMTPKLAGRFTGAVDMMAWLEVLEDDPPCTRVLHLAGNNKVLAKFRRAPTGPEADIPFDLYWRNPEIPENSPLVSLLGTLLGGDPWPKDRHLAPTGVRAGLIRRKEEAGK